MIKKPVILICILFAWWHSHSNAQSPGNLLAGVYRSLSADTLSCTMMVDYHLNDKNTGEIKEDTVIFVKFGSMFYSRNDKITVMQNLYYSIRIDDGMKEISYIKSEETQKSTPVQFVLPDTASTRIAVTSDSAILLSQTTTTSFPGIDHVEYKIKKADYSISEITFFYLPTEGNMYGKIVYRFLSIDKSPVFDQKLFDQDTYVTCKIGLCKGTGFRDQYKINVTSKQN